MTRDFNSHKANQCKKHGRTCLAVSLCDEECRVAQ